MPWRRSEILLALAGFCFLPQIAFAQEKLPWEIKEKNDHHILMLLRSSEVNYKFYVVPESPKTSVDQEIKLKIFKKETTYFDGSLFSDRRIGEYLTSSVSDEERNSILGMEGEKSVILYVKELGKDASVYPELNFEVSFFGSSYATRIKLTEMDSFSFPKQKR